jgi:Tfp pilus assembly protein PilF
MRRCLPALLALCALSTACGPSGDARSPTRAPLASQWLERAKASYRSGDFDDARESAKKALAAAPSDPDARELAARIALVRLDYAEALQLTEGLSSNQAHGIRGRAYWLSGDIEHAADELEALLADPSVKDSWAHDVAGLARRGVGRHPFAMDGALVAAVDVPRAIERVPLGAAIVVPCELDGERVLALMATGTSEVLLDSNSRHEPAWVSFRFDRVEISDVPALVQDLSPISRQLGVPIKAMIGAQLLRHAHATFDRRGDQFIVRRRDAPPPPDASRVPLFYMRGGGMVLRATVTTRDEGAIPFYVDSSRNFPLLLKDAAWQKAGVDVRSLTSLPDTPNVKTGIVPTFRMGGFDLAKMPALEGIDMSELISGTDVDLAGVVGADLLSFFRVTFADDGRFIWIEPDPSLLGSVPPADARAGAPSSSSAPSQPAPAPAVSAPPSAPRR